MDFGQLLSIILHVDKALGMLIAQYGILVYVVLFLIVFCETGLVVFPFLPGDTLLFIAGAFGATGALNMWVLIPSIFIAAIGGNTVNYWIGRKIGEKVFTHDYRWLDRQALLKTQAFYINHGGKTIVLSRFVPVVRTFAPFVAGVSKMSQASFNFYNIIGGAAWVGGLTVAGYFFGNIPMIRDHLNSIVLIGVAAAVLPVMFGAGWKFIGKIRGRA